MEKRDISKDVVVALLLLTVVVALVGTWSVTNAASNIKFSEEITTENSVKTSGLVIATEPAKPTFGKVGITISNPGDDI